MLASLERLRKKRKIWRKIEADELFNEHGNDELLEENYSLKKERKVYPRESYRDSIWYRFCQRDLPDLNSRDGKTFRLRFTVPYSLLKQILTFAECWFPQRAYDACGKETTPVFLKLLGTLRMLGKGCTWDLLYELSGVSAEVHRKWTLAFLDKFSKELYPVYVHGPRNNEELNQITSLYAAWGFPGCVGSTDSVHIRWESSVGIFFQGWET
jgi:hypothetical protein